MAGEQIKVTITPKGVTVDASGFKGKACLAELAKFEKFMADNGITVDNKETKMKAEANLSETTGTHQTVGQR